MLLTTMFFLLALLILVIVHEYGHFQVARWCGVKVLRFSFGFGKVLFKRRDKKGTEYLFSLFPIGGYVKMLGESAETVSENEKPMAFNNKPIWMRIAIVLAGPLFNFIFAFIALWLVLVIGTYSLAPIIQSVRPDSIVAKAGMLANQELLSINGEPIKSWRTFQYSIMPFIGSNESISLGFKSITDGKQGQIFIPLTAWKLDDNIPDPIRSLGIEPFIPQIAPVIGDILAHSPATKTNLQVNDKILRVDKIPIEDWLSLVKYVKAHPDTSLALTISRDGGEQTVLIKTGHQSSQGKIEGFLGLHPQKVNWPAKWLRLEKEGPFEAIPSALKQTWDLSGATFILMGRLLTGKLGLKSISGPLGIAQGAGHSGRNGVVSYLFFLALVSISLGAINLLPIPLLDGGHLLYYAVEMIRGKPLSDNIKNMGVYFGVVLLAVLMCIAFTNDISRLIK